MTATATDAGSNLKSAEYSLEGGAWTAMAASDGTFDEKSEGLTATISGPLAVGTYEVCVRATDTADNASDGEDCDTFAVTAAAMTITADPNASSTGGGWYFVDLGPGSKYKLNFGYTVQRNYDRKVGDWLTSGNVLWIGNNAYKLKDKIDEGGKLPASQCASDFSACAASSGDGVLYEHNPDYSAYYCSLGETYRCLEWGNPQPVTITFFVNDGGTSKVCTTNAKGKTTCKESLKPDAFGMQLDIVSLGQKSNPILLNGGNVIVR